MSAAGADVVAVVVRARRRGGEGLRPHLRVEGAAPVPPAERRDRVVVVQHDVVEAGLAAGPAIVGAAVVRP